ncbi:MAG: hypothetical protein K2Q27_02170, partial [Novosphingobium sp.]|nr:hypothetical protein [Novosphingobium sp.]
ARSLPTGPESFGRGCLKGSFHMQLSRHFRKCEMGQVDCTFCNTLITIAHEWPISADITAP